MDTTHPALEQGTVVRWRTSRTAGIGQLERIDPDGTAHVRAWLPTRSHTIRTAAGQLTVLPELTEEMRRATTAAGYIAAGLR